MLPNAGPVGTIYLVSHRSFWHAASAAFFKDYPILAGSMTSTVAVLTALMTFLKPAERASSHKSSGDQYLALRNDSRVFREVSLLRVVDDDAAVNAMMGLTTRRNELNAASPGFSVSDYKRAKAGIDAGEALHAVDKNA